MHGGLQTTEDPVHLLGGVIGGVANVEMVNTKMINVRVRNYPFPPELVRSALLFCTSSMILRERSLDSSEVLGLLMLALKN